MKLSIDRGDRSLKEGETLPVLGWNKQNVEEFQGIWMSMVGTTSEDLKILGINLLIWMFENIPNMNTLFKQFDATKTRAMLVSDERFLKHTQRVVVSLNKVIRKLDRMSVIDDIRNLSVKHLMKSPPVVPHFFEDFRDRFHLLLAEMIGPDAERQTQLWYEFLDMFVTLHKEEEEKMGMPTEASKASGESKCCSIS